jgi:hypothetical protein
MSKLFISYVRYDDITYFKKHATKSQRSLIYIHVLKIGKFGALDFSDVLDFFATDCTVGTDLKCQKFQVRQP